MRNHYCFLCGNSNNGHNEKLSFFQFPKDERRREEWLTLCNVDRKFLKKDSCLCQQHFSEEDIGGRDNRRRQLKRNAIPKLYLSRRRKLLEVPAQAVYDNKYIRKIVSEKQPDLLSFLDETAASASLFEEVLRERTRKKSPQESASSSLVERHSVDLEHIPQTQPDKISVLDERSASSSPFREFPSEQIREKILHESALSNQVEIHLHDERISKMQPDNVYLLDERAAPLSLSSKRVEGTISSKSAISGLVGVNSEENEQWELSMTLSEYIKQKEKEIEQTKETIEQMKETIEQMKETIEQMKETVQRLENELKDKSLCVPLAETPTRNEDPDSELLFRYAGDIGTPHCKTPGRALRGIRILRSALQHERSSKKMLQQKFRRAQGKINSLNGVIDELRNANLILKPCTQI